MTRTPNILIGSSYTSLWGYGCIDEAPHSCPTPSLHRDCSISCFLGPPSSVRASHKLSSSHSRSCIQFSVSFQAQQSCECSSGWSLSTSVIGKESTGLTWSERRSPRTSVRV